jgi:hypothetical protein
MQNKQIKNTATIKILQKLLEMKKDRKPVKLNSYYVEREMIPRGRGALSCSRLLRLLRQDYKLIKYDDPRKKNHIYEINFNKKEVKRFINMKINKKGRKSA